MFDKDSVLFLGGVFLLLLGRNGLYVEKEAHL